MKAGELVSLSFTVTPSNLNVTPEWKYNSEFLTLSPYSGGTVIQSLKEGQTTITATVGDYSAVCIVTISGVSDNYVDGTDPYIYSSTSIMQMKPQDNEKIYVSLYGGTIADTDGYTWTVDNSSVATLTPSGQYCSVKANGEGYARIKVTHTKAAYPYYIGVYVYADSTKSCYITTTNNIVTLYKSKGDSTISVDLVNPVSDNYKQNFEWTIKDGSTDCLSYKTNGANAVLTPVKTGTCTLRVTHPDATGGYPLDIVVRVIEIVQNVYIEPSDTVVYLSGSTSKTVSAVLKGLNSANYSNDEFTWTLDNTDIASEYHYGNQCVLTGLHNGAANLTIAHPASAKTRQVLLIITDQTADAVDASCYITTTQNFIKTKVGAESTAVSVSLKGGSEGSEKNFVWSVKQSPKDAASDVIRLDTTTGTVNSSRMAANTYTGGYAQLTPLSEGTATITVTNSKSLYPTEILVKVLSKDALLESPLYITGSSLVKFLNGASYDYTCTLQGNLSSSDENSIAWKSDSEKLQVLGSGTKAVLTSSGTGTNISHVTVSHPKAANPKQVLAITADTQAELDAAKAFYSSRLYISVNAGKTANAIVENTGFVNADGSDYDFSALVWTSSDPKVASVEKSAGDNLCGIITGISAGTAQINATYYDTSLTFTATVYPADTDITKVEKTCYLTTTNNVVVFSSANLSKTVTVTAVNLASDKAAETVWTSADGSVAQVAGNGTSAVITSVKEGETYITVSNPASENALKMYVKIGSEYASKDTKTVYISSSQDVVTLTRDAAPYMISEVLVNSDSSTNNAFAFAIDDSGIADITGYSTGKCFIDPKACGQAEITVTNPAASIDKKILVVVGNTAEELASFKYLTTGSNVVTIGEGTTKTVSVSVKNSDDVLLDGYTWSSDDSSTAGITATTSATAVVTGNKIGTTRISVSQSTCKYPLTIIVQVIDPIAAAANPYIQTTASVLTLTKSTTWTTVTAELVGGTDDDVSNFVWSSDDTSVIQAYGQSGVGKVRALKAGTAYLTVKHPKAAYDAQILCICDEAAATNCSISAGESIITMKPTDSAKTVTVSLVNGDDADKNNFKWSLDVYDIVDLDTSANTALITPLKQGTATLTVSHPKSAYDQKIVIKVSEYDKFAFGAEKATITAGSSTFVSMQVPTTTVKSEVVYYTENDNEKVVKLYGTNAICQITGLADGTATVKANLVASASRAVLATAEMLVNVQPTAADYVYITSSETIYTMEKGTNRTFTASLTGTGVIATDQYNLQWKSSDPSIVKLSGTSATGIATGQQVYATAVSAGETTITISHEKSKTNLVYKIIVPGSATKTILIAPTYVKLTKGKTSEIKSTITDGDNADYTGIIWTCPDVNGNEIVRVMGSGKTVTLYGLNPGNTKLTATLADGTSSASCDVWVEASHTLTFGTTTVSVHPGEDKNVPYYITPASDTIEQIIWSDDLYATVTDNGHDSSGNGTLAVHGIKDGKASLTCVTDSAVKASASVTVAWNYSFALSQVKFTGSPDKKYECTYSVNPPDAEISCESQIYADISIVSDGIGKGTGKITIVPASETGGVQTVTLTAVNPAMSGETIGTKDIAMNFAYTTDEIKQHIAAKITDHNGDFSRFDDSGTLIIGDGETVELGADCSLPKAKFSVSNIDFTAASGSTITKNTNIDDNMKLDLVDGDPVTMKVYKITELYQLELTISYDCSYYDEYTRTDESLSGKTVELFNPGGFTNIGTETAPLYRSNNTLSVNLKKSGADFGKANYYLFRSDNYYQRDKDYSNVNNFIGIFASKYSSDALHGLVNKIVPLGEDENEFDTKGGGESYFDNVTGGSYNYWTEMCLQIDAINRKLIRTLDKPVYLLEDGLDYAKYPDYWIPASDYQIYGVAYWYGGYGYNSGTGGAKKTWSNSSPLPRYALCDATEVDPPPYGAVYADSMKDSPALAGNLIVNYIHNGKAESVCIRVVREVRICGIKKN